MPGVAGTWKDLTDNVNFMASNLTGQVRNIADVTDTFGDLKEYEKSGGKLLTLVGGNDQLIMPRGVINYYRERATHGHKAEFEKLQEFYRLFRAPGAGHCVVPNAFSALVNWVENGVAPEQIIAASTVGGVPRTRPLCPYPQTAICAISSSRTWLISPSEQSRMMWS